MAQKYVVWAAAILLWIFGLSVLLSYLSFGYLDLDTIGHMAWILSPLLVMAVILLNVFKHQPADFAGRKRVPRAVLRVKEQTR